VKRLYDEVASLKQAKVNTFTLFHLGKSNLTISDWLRRLWNWFS